MMKGINKKATWIGLGLLVMIGLVGLCLFIEEPIQFNHPSEIIEINSDYDPLSFIKKVRGEMEDVTYDSDVDNTRLGDYTIIYTFKDKDYKLPVTVADTVAPEFSIVDIESEVGFEVEPESFAKSIKDETECQVSYKEDYSFDEEGKQDITIVVSDQGGNETEKTAMLTLVKDEKAPVLTGVRDLKVTKGSKVNYLAGISISDDYDAHPQIEVDSSKVKIKKIGTYKITYTAVDRSGNKKKYKAKVKVVKENVIQSVPMSDEKIVYLTFDDGPSSNTQDILDILDEYDVKATFFVTGTSKKYRYLIKTAYDKGHTIGLHTYTHKYSTVYKSIDSYFEDLDKVGKVVEEQIGFVPKYIRFPGGSSNTISRHYNKKIMSKLVVKVQKKGYQYYDWNVDSGDASSSKVSVKKIVKSATNSSKDNVMILFHDAKTKTNTVKALPQIIEYYQKEGYSFKAIDDSSFTCHHRVMN